MNYQRIRVAPLSAHVGAEIGGVDLAAPVSDPVMAEIRHAFGEYGVVFFRDQHLTPEQNIAVAERFGPIDVNRFFAAVPGYPMIAEVRKEPAQTRNIGGGWHTDHTYDKVPALGSMLYAREVPQTGGDTLFASMYAAYDALSDGLKAALEGLRACHSSRHVFGAEAVARRGDLNGQQPGAGDAGCGAPGRHPAPGNRPQGALRQSGLHDPHRGLEDTGIKGPARLSFRALPL
jgi:taurine dioxygenase